MFRAARLALIALSTLAAAPSAAQAGFVQAPPSGEPATRGCPPGQCAGRYEVTASGPGEAYSIDPTEGRDFANGESAYVDLPSGFSEVEWRNSVQGLQVHTDLGGTATGSNWQVVVCRPSTTSDRVCSPSSPIVVWKGSSVVYSLDTPGAVVRVVLQYVGESGRPSTGLIRLQGRSAWLGVDTVAPVLSALLADAPLAGEPKVTAAAAPVLVSVSGMDNVGLGAAEVGVGNDKPTPLPTGEGEVPLLNGRRPVTVRQCDVAAPPNCATVTGTPTIDTGVPQVSVPPVIASRDPRPTFDVKASDPEVDGFASGLERVVLVLGEQPTDAEAMPVAGGFRVRPRTALPEGRYALGLKVLD